MDFEPSQIGSIPQVILVCKHQEDSAKTPSVLISLIESLIVEWRGNSVGEGGVTPKPNK